ncbi:MAG TPA: CoA transferase [Dehalococcoidia bacterium]|nr:CoA transferase [Dehalococcoidia bacterium]
MSGPLEGIRIADMTIWQQGTSITALLGDLGADIIKVENWDGGDPGRTQFNTSAAKVTTGVASPRNWYFETQNRNKRSLRLNLRKPKGKEVFYRLIAKCDVFVTNYSRDVPVKLGVDYETLSKYNPRLIWAITTGFGPKGPDSERPCFDYLGQARSGIMFAIGEPGTPPLYNATGISNQMTATLTALNILAALIARDRQGIGQAVETSQLGAMMWLQGINVNAVAMDGTNFFRVSRTRASNPLWNHYRCADDKWIALAMLQADRYWPRFCRILGISELEKDPRFENMDRRRENCEELVAILDRQFATRPREEWVRLFRQEPDFIFSVLNSIPDLVDDPQVMENDYLIEFDHPRYGPIKEIGIPMHFGKTPGSVRLPAPQFGEHSDEILRDICGYSQKEIEQLRREGVI